MLEGRKRAADVVAIEPVRALRIDADDLRDLVAAHAGFARTLEAFADARRASTFLRRQGPFAGLPVVLGVGGVAVAIPVLRTASPTDFGIVGILVAFVGLLVAGIGHEIAHA
ncbi:MAG TPA: hypothetical protein VGA16_08265, partial [Candidatus Limnocylindria bacterium]